MASSSPSQSSSSTIPAPVAPGAQACHMPDTISPKKAALLIGICGKTKGQVLKGPHKDVKRMHVLLVGRTVHVQPTEHNILKAIDSLVGGARAGDQFFFHFAGHASQIDTKNPEEEDGKDECIVSSDDKLIQDDVLYEHLIKPLPPKAKLTAVMDACHSGTILDLKHHTCNQVYVPWISKGRRCTETLWSRVVKKNDMIVAKSLKSTLIDENSTEPSVADTQRSSSCVATKRSTPLSVITNMSSNLGENHILNSPGHSVEYSSPISKFCDGFKCRRSSLNAEEPERADVVCLSSSQDSQRTWETPTGASMSQILIEFLHQNPNPVLEDLMFHVCHAIHQTLINLHDKSRNYKRKVKSYNAKHLQPREQESQHSHTIPAKRKRKSGPKSPASKRPTQSGKENSGQRIKAQKPAPVAAEVEMINFQDPELSSHLPLDMKSRQWDM